MAYLNDRQLANFNDMVSPEPNSGCWLWTGYINSDGYGHFNVRGSIEKAHRVSFRAFRGEIPSGYLVLHSCDQPCCVNPQHLRIGTDVENAADKARRRRAPTKLSDDQVNEIRSADGRYCDIADAYGVSAAWVCRIKGGQARSEARRVL
ncbi:hypothetical protein CQ062_13705 [Ochrobactrum sp. MYb68]|nr:hypothetical protein CQ062_13705 [Ochrobactrum sp. MYb68]